MTNNNLEELTKLMNKQKEKLGVEFFNKLKKLEDQERPKYKKDDFEELYLCKFEPYDELKTKLIHLSNDELKRLYLKTKAKRFQDEIINRWMNKTK